MQMLSPAQFREDRRHSSNIESHGSRKAIQVPELACYMKTAHEFRERKEAKTQNEISNRQAASLKTETSFEIYLHWEPFL